MEPVDCGVSSTVYREMKSASAIIKSFLREISGKKDPDEPEKPSTMNVLHTSN
jgi:hypothetical protein